jgi:hypothetical protein
MCGHWGVGSFVAPAAMVLWPRAWGSCHSIARHPSGMLCTLQQVMGVNIMREVKIGAQLGRGHLNIVKPKDLILTRCATVVQQRGGRDGDAGVCSADLRHVHTP